jgi:hypothetical protein
MRLSSRLTTNATPRSPRPPEKACDPPTSCTPPATPGSTSAESSAPRESRRASDGHASLLVMARDRRTSGSCRAVSRELQPLPALELAARSMRCLRRLGWRANTFGTRSRPSDGLNSGSSMPALQQFRGAHGMRNPTTLKTVRPLPFSESGQHAHASSETRDHERPVRITFTQALCREPAGSIEARTGR